MTRPLRLALIFALLCLQCLHTASANDIPWRPGTVDLQAANEPLTVLLLRFLSRQRIAASISEMVGNEAVNGRFRGRPDVVFRELADAYGLNWYFDGAMLHVTSLAENQTRLLWMDPVDAGRAEKVLREMRIIDARFPVRFSSAEGYVVVSGPPRMVELVVDALRLMNEAPANVSRVSATRVFRLKHAWADDTKVNIGGVETFVPGVARTLNEMLGGSGLGEALPRSRQTPRRLTGLRGSGLVAVGQTEPAAAAGSGASRPAGADASAAPATSAASRSGTGTAGEAAAAAVAVQLTTPAMVRADPRLNAVIVRDHPDRLAMYAELIAALDVPSALVEVEASVIDVQADTSQTLGIDWRASRNQIDIVSSPGGLAGDGRPPRNAANDLLFSDNPTSAGTGFVGTLIFGSARSYFLARINALAEQGYASLVARPRVLTLDNNEAILQSTREFFVRVAGREQVDLFNVSVGLVLRVTPTLVEEDGQRRFKLMVRIEDGAAGADQSVDSIPVVTRNSIVTQAVIGEGESLLIGGYVIDESRRLDSGVPVLGKLPVVGRLFRQDTSSSRRVERLFMITPRVVSRVEGG
jgi:type III secretion protein C